jgi:hypothetical protein
MRWMPNIDESIVPNNMTEQYYTNHGCQAVIGKKWSTNIFVRLLLIIVLWKDTPSSIFIHDINSVAMDM